MEGSQSRSTVYRFMKKNVLIYDDRIIRHEHSKMRHDIFEMRDDYLEWIEKYQKEDCCIYFEDDTLVLNNMTCNKIWNDVLEKGLVTVSQSRPEGYSHLYCSMQYALTHVYKINISFFGGSKSKNLRTIVQKLIGTNSATDEKYNFLPLQKTASNLLLFLVDTHLTSFYMNKKRQHPL